ncbi:MAG: S24 family peptidase [Alphaproteobacteria bacterium]|nr:S24 family peptidase [Alphaproteobacteria bacterium]
MRTPEEIRKFIDSRIKEKGFSLNEVSLAIGQNGTYLFQYINRGSPKRLGEIQRAKLAKILDVDESEISDVKIYSDKSTSPRDKIFLDYVAIDMLDVTACCGNGLENLTENVNGKWMMPIDEFRNISLTSPENVKLIAVKGDSMTPTIQEGDWVFVDITRIIPDSDGMFLLRLSTGLVVKRLQGGLNNEIIIKSDNPHYSDLTAQIGEVQILGKVIYILKAEKVG